MSRRKSAPKRAKQVDRGPAIKRAAQRAGIAPKLATTKAELADAIVNAMSAELAQELLAAQTPANSVEQPTDEVPPVFSRELRSLAGKLAEAQNSIIASQAGGSGPDDILEALIEVWSVKTSLECWATRIASGDLARPVQS